MLADGLHERGHDVTVFASGDSKVSCKLVPLVPKSLWSDGIPADADGVMADVVDQVRDMAADFDVIHSHIEWFGFDWAQRSRTPVVATLHGRIDVGPTARLLPQYPDIPLIAISENQRAFWPDQNWLATIHHGLPLDGVPLGTGSGGYLLFVGRITPEKGVDAAIEVARRTGYPLFVAAKAIDEKEVATYHRDVKPHEGEGIVNFLGEVGPPARDKLFGDAAATLMMGDWPEPFGLVAVESMAAGTPVVALRSGALPETVRHGIDGFLVESVDEAVSVVPQLPRLDRDRIRTDALRRFNAERMIDDYERLFLDLASGRIDEEGLTERQPRGQTPLGVP